MSVDVVVDVSVDGDLNGDMAVDVPAKSPTATFTSPLASTTTSTSAKSSSGDRWLHLFWFAVGLPSFVVVTVAMMAAAATPSVILLCSTWDGLVSAPLVARLLLVGMLVAPAYFLFALFAVFGGSLLAWPFRGALVEGKWPLYSPQVQRYGAYGVVMGVVHLLLLPRMSPLAGLWINLMGGRCGKRLFCANPVGFSDLPLLTLGDDVVIGSNAVIICHQATRGSFRLSPVRIGRGVSIGTHAVILGGTTVGDFATVAPNSLVQPGTVIGKGEVWAGVPAVQIHRHKTEAAAAAPVAAARRALEVGQ